MLRLFAAYEEEREDSASEIVQVLEYLSGGQLFEKIIESPYGKIYFKCVSFSNVMGNTFKYHFKFLSIYKKYVPPQF